MSTSNHTTKQCTKCKQEFPATPEYFHVEKRHEGGLRSVCKSCRNASQLEYRRNNPDKCRLGIKNAMAKKPEHYRELDRKKRKHKREHYNELSRLYRYSHIEKARARSAVTHAVRDGKLQPISTQHCACCGIQARDYHHWSYEPEHWLDVIPLCRKCHKMVHTGTEVIE